MPVRVFRDGRAGRIVLDRPEALNALDGAMIAACAEALRGFEADPAVHLVIVEGAGERAFCAGGDVRTVHSASAGGDANAVEAFFAAEYALNRQIAAMRTPYVALIDGICMGGGVGMAIHGRARVAGVRATFAMPEVGIGLFPDVGMSFLLPRMPGALGMYLGLTGARLAGADAAHTGYATHFSTCALGDLATALARDGVAALAGFAVAPPPFSLAPHRALIDHAFAADDVPAIVARLEAAGSDFARATLAAMRAASPSALCWTHELIRRGAARDLDACLDQELRLTRTVTRHPDIVEGIRAAVIDKDRAPRWSPPRLEDVDPAIIAAITEVL